MEFKIEKAALLQGLYLAQGIADRKSTMPILANVLLAHRWQGQAARRCHRSERHRHRRAALQGRERGRPHRRRQAPARHRQVAPRRRALAQAHREPLRRDPAPARSTTRSSAWPIATFPKLPNHREVKFAKVDAATLRDMIAKTFFSISTDETRYHLNGVLFECDGKVARMVSTDGHRLSKVERPLEGGPKLAQGDHHPAQGPHGDAARARDRRGRRRARHPQRPPVPARRHHRAVGQADRRAVPAVRSGDPEGERQGRDCAAPGAPRGAQAHQLMSSDKTWGVKLALAKGELQDRQRQPRSRRGARGARRQLRRRAARRSASTPSTSSSCSARWRATRSSSSSTASSIPAWCARPTARRAATSASSCRCASDAAPGA